MLDLLWFAGLGAVVYKTCSQPLGRGGGVGEGAQAWVASYLCSSPPLAEKGPELVQQPWLPRAGSHQLGWEP